MEKLEKQINQVERRMEKYGVEVENNGPAPKFIFILENGIPKILIGKVNKHKDFLKSKEDNVKVFGGGFWKLDHENKKVLISGKSTEFGNFDYRFLIKTFPDAEIDMNYIDDTYIIDLPDEYFNKLNKIE